MKREPFNDRSRTRRARNFAAGAALFFFIVVAGGSARAQLRWESRELEFHPSLTDTQVVAQFHFTNAGSKPIKIKDVTTSCGCTTARLDKNHIYAPGEKGTIIATYDIGGHNGAQKETIDVTTSDPAEPELSLQLTAVIPKLLDISTIFLNWQRGEELKPETVAIKVLGDYPVHSIGVSSSNPNVAVEMKHAEGSRDYELVVTPKKADGEFTIIELKPDYPKDPPKLYHVYATVAR
jgi:hypothetical protein